MRLTPFPLLLTVSSCSLVANAAKPKAASLAITLGIVPLMTTWDASDETRHAVGSDAFDGTVTVIVLAVLFFPVVLSVALGGLERLKSWLRARRSGSKPQNKR